MANMLPTPQLGYRTGVSADSLNLDAYIKESVDSNIAGGNTFDDAAALRANGTYVDGTQYFVSVLTGGVAGGEWVYDATDAQTDDGSTVIKPNAIDSGDPGRYTRLTYILLGG